MGWSPEIGTYWMDAYGHMWNVQEDGLNRTDGSLLDVTAGRVLREHGPLVEFVLRGGEVVE